MKHFQSPSQSFEDSHSKDSGPENKNLKLLTILIDLMQDGIWTNQKLARETGAKISTICRYRRDLELAGAVSVLFRTKDPITGYPADFYTANRSIIRSMKGGSSESR